MVVNRFGPAARSPSWPPCSRWAWACSRSGHRSASLPVVVGLFLFGFGNGAWDVAMNVQGAAVEQRLGRAIMPALPRRVQRRHGGRRPGRGRLVALGVSVTAHLLAVAW